MEHRPHARGDGFLRRHGVKLAALGVILAAYGFARLPQLPPAERQQLAAAFRFTGAPLPVPPGPRQKVRQVHPDLEHISAWISSVGAAVALADLDGDGLPNDVCYVDNGTDRLVVTPAPGSAARYSTFTLEAAPLPYDRATMAPMGCVPGDLNEDGLQDLLAYYWGRSPIAFLRRGGDEAPPAAERYRAVEVAAGGERWYTNAATRADVDGDGRVDLLVGNYFPDGAAILHADGGGRRERMHGSMSRADDGGRNRLLLLAGGSPGPEPTVTFRDASEALSRRAATGWTLALGAADLDGDLLPEIYLANDFGPDVLLHNRSAGGHLELVPVYGRKGLATPSSKVLGRDSFKGMGVDFADLDGDGWLDIYVSNIADEYALEESHFLWLSTGDAEALAQGRAPFADKSEPLGLARSSWGWESRLADFDNDGVLEAVQATGFVKGTADRWPDLHETAMGNDQLLRHPFAWPGVRPGDDLSGHEHNPFFVRSASGRFFDLAAEVGLGQAMVSRGIATADVDGDGDLDFAVANQWEASYLFRNDSPRPGRSLILDLRRPVDGGEGTASTPAVGAAVKVAIPGGRQLVAQVDGGNGHSGVRSHEVHLGVGDVGAGQRLPVLITWRDGSGVVHREQRFLTPGRHTVVLGEDDPAAKG